MKIAVLWNINRERNFIMPAGKCIDKNIKRFYKRLKKVKLKNKRKIDNVYSYTEYLVDGYIEDYKKLIDEICEVTHSEKDKLKYMIFKDVLYHIYENIYFLDVRYNVDDDIKTLKHNKKIGEEQEEFDIIPLRDYLKSKRYDNKQKRRFRDRKNKSNDPIKYKSRNIYSISKACKVYTDYCFVLNELDEKQYLCKPYLDIIDFFYEDKITKTNVKSKLRDYVIWDIEKVWLPTINDFYKTIKEGKNNLFEFQLLEKLFKFRTFLHIYYNFLNDKNAEDMICCIQPFTYFGYSVCMDFILKNYNILESYELEDDCAGGLFFIISDIIKKILARIVQNILSLKTNNEKKNRIRTYRKGLVDKIKNNIKNKEKNRDEDDEIINDEYHAIECFFSEIKSFFDYDYVPEKFSNKDFEMYKEILFNDRFRQYLQRKSLFEYEDEILRGEGMIEAFYNSINVLNSIDEIDDETEDDSIIKLFTDNRERVYDFGFSDLLYLITEQEYEDYYAYYDDEEYDDEEDGEDYDEEED